MSDDGIKRPWPLDTATMEADLVDLASRRPDLSDWRRTELYLSAVFRFRDFPGGEAGLAEQREIFAWVDIVSPPEARATTQMQSPMERLVRMLIGRDTDRLLVGPDPPTTAAPLAALAEKRPDLSVVERHELLLAARGSLGRMDQGRRIEATDEAIFAWINVVVPVRTRHADGLRTRGRPKGSRYIADRQAVLDAYRRAKRRTDRNPSSIPSQEVVADELNVSRRALADFLKAERVPWPPE